MHTDHQSRGCPQRLQQVPDHSFHPSAICLVIRAEIVDTTRCTAFGLVDEVNEAMAAVDTGRDFSSHLKLNLALLNVTVARH